jgi:hypothetical protein
MMVTPGWDRAGSDASHYAGNVGDHLYALQAGPLTHVRRP